MRSGTLMETLSTDATAAGVPLGCFEEFYAAAFRPLMLQLWAYTGDHAQAQDVVQEAFCRAFARWERISGYDDPAAWVRRVAWNLASSRFRQLRSMRAFVSRHRETPVPGPDPDRVALVAALAELPARYRRALVMFHLGDFPVREIAEQEGVSEGTVKSWLHRGRTALAGRLSLKEDGDV